MRFVEQFHLWPACCILCRGNDAGPEKLPLDTGQDVALPQGDGRAYICHHCLTKALKTPGLDLVDAKNVELTVRARVREQVDAAQREAWREANALRARVKQLEDELETTRSTREALSRTIAEMRNGNKAAAREAALAELRSVARSASDGLVQRGVA